MKKKILIISAHPDDETIGMGGTLLKHKKHGDGVFWLILTEAYTPQWSREYIERKAREIRAIAKMFGFKKTFEARFPSMHLNSVPTSVLCDAVTKVVAEIAPDTVYCPPPHDVNTDHRLAFEAARVAVRTLPKSPVKEFIAYEIPVTTRFGDVTSAFVPNMYEDISAELAGKIRAFGIFRTEVRQYPHPRSKKGLEILARERGLAIGTKAAEAFIIVKSVRI